MAEYGDHAARTTPGGGGGCEDSAHVTWPAVTNFPEYLSSHRLDSRVSFRESFPELFREECRLEGVHQGLVLSHSDLPYSTGDPARYPS